MSVIPNLPVILQNGTVADANQVMANFLQILASVNANAAHNGINSDITSLIGLTTPLPVSGGGTGSASASGARTSLGAAASGANSDITSLTGLTTPLAVAEGGTAGTDGPSARLGIGAAASGANSDITSLTGLTTPLPVSEGGTGANTAAGALTNLGAVATTGPNAVRAWFVYNGQTQTLIASSGVASITRTGVGNYQVNFSVAFADSNYGFNLTARDAPVGGVLCNETGSNTGSFLFVTFNPIGAAVDAQRVSGSFYHN